MPKLGKIKEQKEKKSYKIYGVRREEELNKLEKDDLPEPLESRWWLFNVVGTPRKWEN